MNSIVTQRFLNCHEVLHEQGKVRSKRQFAISLDYHAQSFSEILKGRRDVTIELLRKAIKTYQINPTYLFCGTGNMFSQSKTEGNHTLTVVTNTAGEELISYVPIAAQAGYGGQLQNPIFFEELPSFTLPDYRFKTGTHRCFDVQGDSMEPTLFTGDKIVCSHLEKENWPQGIKDNFVYVIITKSDVLVKRVNNKIKEENALEFVSDNNFYSPYKVSIEDILELWYVRVKISPFMPSPGNARNAFQDQVDALREHVCEQSLLIKNLNVTIEKMLKRNRETSIGLRAVG